jgi:hypothetical protein
VIAKARLNRLRKSSAPGRKDAPQGLLKLKPDEFSIAYGTVENHQVFITS